MATKKTWTEKLESPAEPVVKRIDKNFAGMKAGQLMLIATPQIITDYVRAVPKGQVIDQKQMRAELAQAHKAEVTCPVTTGIFLRIVAEAANESYEKGTAVSALPPVWRVADEKAPLWKKVSFDPDYMLTQQASETG